MTKRQEFLRWSGSIIVPMILWGFYILLLSVELNFVNCSDCGGLFVIDCVIERWWKTTQNNFESYQKTVSQWFTDGLTKYLQEGGVSNWVIVALVLAVYTGVSFFLENLFQRVVGLVVYTGLHARTSRWMLCVWVTCWANLISQIQSVSVLILMVVCWVGSVYNFDPSGLIEGTFAAFVGSELSFWGQNKFLQWLICVIATFFIFLFGLTDPPNTHANGSNDQPANQNPQPTQLLEQENEHHQSHSEHEESESDSEYEDTHSHSEQENEHGESHSEKENEHGESHSEQENEHESHSEQENEHDESHSQDGDEHQEAHSELEIRVDRHDGTYEYYYFLYAQIHDDGSFYYSWLSREGAHYFYGRLTRDRRQYYYGQLTRDGMRYVYGCMIDSRAHYYSSRVILNGIQYHYVRLYRVFQPQRNIGGNADHARRSLGRKRKRVNADAADDTKFGCVSRPNKQFRATMR